MAGKATRTIVIPGGKVKRWRNKQHNCSEPCCDHFDSGRHPDQIRTKIDLRELPFFDDTTTNEEPEPPIQVGHGRFRRHLTFVSSSNDLVACCA